MSPRAALPFALATALVAAPAAVTAQPIPVLSVDAGPRTASPSVVARVAAAVGPEARHDAALSAALTTRMGRYVPAGDPLAARREALRAAVASANRSSFAAASAALDTALRAFEDPPERRDALVTSEANRAAYREGLTTLAILLAYARSDGLDRLLERALDFDPAWGADGSALPRQARERLTAVRALRAARPHGTLRVVTPREGCTVTVDGAQLPGNARERTAELMPGDHLVFARCDRDARLRTVTLAAGETAVTTVDPRLDAALAVEGAPALRYESVPDRDAHLDADAARVGAALGAAHVVLVGDDSVRVVDVRSAATRTTLDARAADLDAALHRALTGQSASPDAAPPAAPAAPVIASTRGPGAGPWVLIGVGAAGLVAGGVLLALRAGAVDDALSHCTPAGVSPCTITSDAAATAANNDYDRARSFDTAAWVSFGVGGAALVGGALWYALAPRNVRTSRYAPSVDGAVTAHGSSLRLGWSF